MHEQKSPLQLAFSSCPGAYPLSSLLQPSSSQCFCYLLGGRGTVHPSSVTRLWLGVCQVGELGWASSAAKESSTCMGTHGRTRYRGLHSPSPALPKVLAQQASFHAAFSAPSSIFVIFHWLIFLRRSTSQAHLQEIPYLPKLAAEWRCMGGEFPSCFSSYVRSGPGLAVVFTSLLCLPARYRLSPRWTGHRHSGLLHQGLDQSVKKKVCLCKCM